MADNLGRAVRGHFTPQIVRPPARVSLHFFRDRGKFSLCPFQAWVRRLYLACLRYAFLLLTVLLYRFRIYSVGGCPPVGLHQVDSANKYGDGEDDESHDRDYGPRPRAEDMVQLHLDPAKQLRVRSVALVGQDETKYRCRQDWLISGGSRC